jgi:hypothetical protein
MISETLGSSRYGTIGANKVRNVIEKSSTGITA